MAKMMCPILSIPFSESFFERGAGGKLFLEKVSPCKYIPIKLLACFFDSNCNRNMSFGMTDAIFYL